MAKFERYSLSFALGLSCAVLGGPVRAQVGDSDELSEDISDSVEGIGDDLEVSSDVEAAEAGAEGTLVGIEETSLEDEDAGSVLKKGEGEDIPADESKNLDVGPIPPPPPSSDEDGEFPRVFSDPEEAPKQGMRWTVIGPFVGIVGRPSTSEEIQYRSGVAYGGFFRPQLAEWLGIRLFYREERLPVDVAPGAFDVEGEETGLDFEQSPLRVSSLGAQIEPTWVVNPRFRLLGLAGWSWMRFVADMPTAPGFDQRALRAGVGLNWILGAGLAFDVIPNWLDFTVNVSHSFVTGQTGEAFEEVQAVVDGEIVHLAPLPEFKYGNDIIFSLGLIL